MFSYKHPGARSRNYWVLCALPASAHWPEEASFVNSKPDAGKVLTIPMGLRPWCLSIRPSLKTSHTPYTSAQGLFWQMASHLYAVFLQQRYNYSIVEFYRDVAHFQGPSLICLSTPITKLHSVGNIRKIKLLLRVMETRGSGSGCQHKVGFLWGYFS